MQQNTRKRNVAPLSVLIGTIVVLLMSCVFQRHAFALSTQMAAHSPQGQQTDAGKVIVVSLAHQWLYAYANGTEVFNTAVMTGRPELGTPTGTYHIFAKMSPTTFYSPFPAGSAEWYPPTHITYAMEWKAGGFFLHDSWWHSVYGPGTNRWHYDPIDGWQSGSHGCIAMPLSAAAWLYNWAPIGTTIQINA